MLKMAEGSSGLMYIMKGYQRRMKKYKCVGKKHPVIMIADNDDAGRGIVNSAAKHYKSNKTGKFIHVTDNLYIVILPKIAGKDTDPEDYFDLETKQKPFKGKCFEPKDKKSDPISKASFAKHIVKGNWETINFDKFKKVLDPIESVIADYKTKLNKGLTPNT